MSGRTQRIIGATPESIRQAENDVGFIFPPSFKAWLGDNNGANIDGIDRIYPVFEASDPRKTWDSVSRNYHTNWAEWVAIFKDRGMTFTNLLPFGDVNDGSLYCFDYSQSGSDGEVPVVLWSHETGATELRAASFADFVAKAEAGDFDSD